MQSKDVVITYAKARTMHSARRAPRRRALTARGRPAGVEAPPR
jgi:hypothetical protein